MPRNMSFALTTEQVKARTKTVTRRMGWTFLKPGTLLQPVAKCQGIPKGGTVEKIGGLIRVTDVRRERLDSMITQLPAEESLRIGTPEVVAEGFTCLSAIQFMCMFCDHNGCQIWDDVTRIEFEYL